MAEYPKMKPLFARRVALDEVRASDIADSMEALARHLGRGKEVGRLQIRLVGKKPARHFNLDMLNGQCVVSQTAVAEPPDFEIEVTEETWVEIANGELSPPDAFLLGRMAVRGKLEFAKRLYAKAKAKGSVDDLPI